MPPFLIPFALMWALVRELYDLFKSPKYRAFLYWFLLLLLVGTIFYNRVEGWGILDSFYFTVVTLATVGYGDLSPTTPVSKLFTVVYIFLGVSFFVTFVSILATDRKRIFESRAKKISKKDNGTMDDGH